MTLKKKRILMYKNIKITSDNIMLGDNVSKSHLAITPPAIFEHHCYKTEHIALLLISNITPTP